MYVFEGRIIKVLHKVVSEVRQRGSQKGTYLASNDERAKEDTFAGPLLERNLQVGLGAVDVHESDQQRRDGYLRASEHIVHKRGERAVVRVAGQRAPTLRRGRTPHCIVDRVCHGVNDILCRSWVLMQWTRNGQWHIPMIGRESLISRSSRRAGECRAGSTRLALCMGEGMVEQEVRDKEAMRG